MPEADSKDEVDELREIFRRENQGDEEQAKDDLRHR